MSNQEKRRWVGIYFAKIHHIDYKEMWNFVKEVDVESKEQLVKLLDGKFK